MHLHAQVGRLGVLYSELDQCWPPEYPKLEAVYQLAVKVRADMLVIESSRYFHQSQILWETRQNASVVPSSAGVIAQALDEVSDVGGASRTWSQLQGILQREPSAHLLWHACLHAISTIHQMRKHGERWLLSCTRLLTCTRLLLQMLLRRCRAQSAHSSSCSAS